MKHFILFVLGFLTAYFLWDYASKPERRIVKKFTTRHLKAVLLVLGIGFAGLIAAVYFRSISLI